MSRKVCCTQRSSSQSVISSITSREIDGLHAHSIFVYAEQTTDSFPPLPP
jgi:hypothetical protein